MPWSFLPLLGSSTRLWYLLPSYDVGVGFVDILEGERVWRLEPPQLQLFGWWFQVPVQVASAWVSGWK